MRARAPSGPVSSSASIPTDFRIRAVSPIQSGVAGWKAFKIRWALSGKGKRDGLRLAVIAHCDSMVVKIVGAWTREAAYAARARADATPSTTGPRRC